MTNRIDHFTIATKSLDMGVSVLREALGVELPRGSKHDMMGTHNCVARAGERCFMELLAIDPEALDPGRARWFSMDEMSTQARIMDRPRALCWVVNTSDLDGVVAASPVDLGEIVHFSRGDRTWRLTVPRDGHLPEGGLLPAFIEWSPGAHPSEAHQTLGLRLDEVRLTHPNPSTLLGMLKVLGVDHLAAVSTGPVGLAFLVSSPNGDILLD